MWAITILIAVVVLVFVISYRTTGCNHDIISQDDHDIYACEECGDVFEPWVCLLPDGASKVRRDAYRYVGVRILQRQPK